MNAWYAVHTQALGELKALPHLARQGFDAYLPRYLKRRRHARRTDWVAAPLFPRYLFVNMDPDAVRWRAINSTVGVSYLVCNGERPVPLPQSVIEDIRAREDAAGMVTVRPLGEMKKGDRIHIVDGALGERDAVFDCYTDDQRVTVLMEILGRQVKVHVAAEALGA